MDTPGWTNGYTYTCKQYAENRWCENGGWTAGHAYLGDPSESHGSGCGQFLTAEKDNCAKVYNFPMENCCACGKGKASSNGTLL